MVLEYCEFGSIDDRINGISALVLKHTREALWIFDDDIFWHIPPCFSLYQDLEMPLDEPQIRECANKILHGLDYLHKHNTIHRDIKAGNVLLTHTGEIKLGMLLCLRLFEMCYR